MSFGQTLLNVTNAKEQKHIMDHTSMYVHIYRLISESSCIAPQIQSLGRDLDSKRITLPQYYEQVKLLIKTCKPEIDMLLIKDPQIKQFMENSCTQSLAFKTNAILT